MKKTHVFLIFILIGVMSLSVLAYVGYSRFDNVWVRGYLNVTEDLKIGTGDVMLEIYYDNDTVTFNTTLPMALTVLSGSYSNGEAYMCVYDNGTIFAKDSACS